jgi:leader peptidase (prepilin peptidase)/N-methyltransferase
MENLPVLMVALLGLAIGSFLNVVIYRSPRKILLAKARSYCPHCQVQLKWYHNIPLASYLVLRGRCFSCEKRIPIRYPLVELLNAAAYVYFWSLFGYGPQFVIWSVLSSALLIVFFIDLDFQIIPDFITLPGMIAGLAVSFVPGGIGIVDAGIGLAVGGGALLGTALLGDWLFKKESMGGGDIKLAAMLGAFVGWQKVLLIFLSSAVIGLVISIAIMTVSAKLRETRTIPFGPFLALAAMLAIVYGDQIIRFYVVSVLGMP